MRTKVVPVSDISVGVRHRKDMGDLQRLADSIDAEGLLQPVGLTLDNELVFGERRLRAIRDILGWDRIPCAMVNVTSIAAGEYAENEIRKNFTTSERVAIAKAVEEKAPERRGKPAKGPKAANGKKPENFPELHKGEETRQAAAKAAGFGNETTYRQAKKAVEKGSPELVKAMDEGAIKPSVAAKLADLPKREQKKAIAGGKVAIKQAVSPPPPPKPTYPLSLGFTKTLADIVALLNLVREDHKTMPAMFKDKRWDPGATEYVVQMVHSLQQTFTAMDKEIRSAKVVR